MKIASYTHASGTKLQPEFGTQRTQRRRRFRRDLEFRPADNSRAGRLDVRRRDLNILSAIARHRYLDTHQICLLFGCACPREFLGNKQSRPAPVVEHRPGCSCTCGVENRSLDHSPSCPALFKDDQHLARRLRELWHAGFLDRPASQILLHVCDGELRGSRPMVYSVTKAGLALLSDDERARIGRGKLSWVGKAHKGNTRLFIEHTLRVADVSIGLDLSLRQRPELRRVSELDLMSGMTEERRNSPRPFSVKGKYQRKKLSAVCDHAFGISHLDSGARRNVVVEVDLGHMPINRAGLNHTSIMRKIIAYASAFEEKQFAQELDWKNVSVVVLTTSSARVSSCVKAAQEFFGSASIARIVLFGTLDASADLLGYQFTDGRGKMARLLD